MNMFSSKLKSSPLIIICLAFIFAMSVHAQDAGRAAWSVLRYDIAAQTNAPDRVMNASATLQARNVGDAAGKTFTVRLNPAIEVRAAQVGGANATFSKGTDARANLQQIIVALPSSVAPNETLTVKIDYRFPLERNSGLASLSTEGAQFLPLSAWYPTPNTIVSPRGADSAPFRLTVTPNAGEAVLSSGRNTGANTFEQTLNAQPFFLTGKWTTIEAATAANITAHLYEGATADERARADELIKLAAAARSFFAQTLGATVDVPMRLVAVRRGAGFDNAGTVLVDAAAFRRPRTDAATALTIAEAAAHIWIGGASAVGGDGAGVIREGLSRYLALLFIEKQFGAEAADAERARARTAYAAVARRDAPLALASPLFDTYFTSVTNKGALVWRLIEQAMGREKMWRVLTQQLQATRSIDKTDADVRALTLAALRAALVAEAGANSIAADVIAYSFDQQTETDLLVGLPQKRGAESIAALRNTGSIPASVKVVATSADGERFTTSAVIPAKDFGEARFATTKTLTRIEIDPEKIYPQLDYANDIAPAVQNLNDEPLSEATRAFTRSDFANAEIFAREALTRTPAMSEARVLLARALLGANKIEAAEAQFKQTIEAALPTANALAWSNIGLGDIALKRGQTAEAARRYDEAARVDAEYASTLAARNKRIQVEKQAGASPVDEAARAFMTRLDAAIKSGRRPELEALIVPGELALFAKGIAGTQPEIWQTTVLRTESQGANRILADVQINTRALGVDQQGTAVFVLARDGSGAFKLADVQFFEVR